METKFNNVKNHLFTNGTINTWDAIKLYGATRLSDIIFKLRKEGFNIESKRVTKKDRNNQICNYVDYVLINDENLVN